MATRLELPKFQAFDSSGDPLTGGLLYTYIVGTSTPKATYTDAETDTAQANPIVLNSRGEADSDIYGIGYYKMVLKTSAGVTIYTIDSIAGVNESTMTTIGDYSGDFDAAITKISTTATTLVIDSAATMSANVTVPATCKVVVTEGGSINQSTYTLTINGPFECNDFQQAFTGTGVVTLARVNYMNPWWWGENTTPGTTDMTYEIQAALTAAYTAKVPVFFPKGTYLTDTLTYYGQSMYGILGSGTPFYSSGRSVIQGMDSKDVFQFPDVSSVTQAYLTGTVLKDITIIVDDSTDASGSFSRGGVGNAGIALQCADGTTANHTYGSNLLINGKFENVNIESLSQTAQNKSCGIFQQAAIYDFVFDHLSISRLEYGFWGAKPATNDDLVEYAPDCLSFLSTYLNGNINPLRIYNSTRSLINGMQVYGSTATYRGISLLSYPSLIRAYTSLWTVNNLYQELNSATTGETSVIQGRKHVFTGCTLKMDYGAHYITWDADSCDVIGCQIAGATAGTAVLKIGTTGIANNFSNLITKTSGMDWLSDTGKANRITVADFDSVDFVSSRIESQGISRVYPAFLRSADFTKSTPSAPYFSSEDLFIWPSDISWLVPVTQPTITKDATIIESGEYLTLPSPGGGYFATANNETITLGYRVPEAKVRIYVKAKMGASATTLLSTIYVNAVEIDSATLSFTTTWSVQSFDADLTGLTKGHTVQLVLANPTVNQDVDVAWVAIVPLTQNS